jgi:hypothetical protein
MRMSDREAFERLMTAAEREEQHLGVHVPDPFTRAPQAKPRVLQKRGLGIAIFALSAVAAGIAALIFLPGNAQASATPAARTCSAFAAWEKHPATANIDAMMADTFAGAGWTASPGKYVIGDAASLYGDWRSGAASKYVNNDVKYMRADCADL